jgi:heavy metal translocating P-type ATPase
MDPGTPQAAPLQTPPANCVELTAGRAKVDRMSKELPPIRLRIEGMNCAACAGRVERALAEVPGVARATVNFALRQASITAVAGDAPPAIDDLVATARAAGYPASPITDLALDNSADEDRAVRTLRRDAWIAGALTLPLFGVEMTLHLVPAVHHAIEGGIGMRGLWFIYCALATLVQFGPGWRFYVQGLGALRRGGPDMNTLVMLGSSAAWAYSVVATFAPSRLPPDSVHVYYEAAAVIITLVLVGRLLEARARGQAGAAIRSLLQLQPDTARVLRDGEERVIPAAEVVVGDVLVVRPGGRIAVDGEVLTGQSRVDESMISGEPLAVAKSTGDLVLAGTINQKGSFTFEATRTGADTVLAGIVRLVANAQEARLPVQAIVDRVTRVFVPLVLVIALAAAAAWLAWGMAPALPRALVSGVAVLIVACPCAMGLATPTSILVASGRAAQLGILFRKGQALQSLGKVSVIAFDKTGTLTAGRPAVTGWHTEPGFDEATVIAAAAAVEHSSEHPLAHALVEAARDRGLSLPGCTDFAAQPGCGVLGTVDGHALQIGALAWLAESGINPSPAAATAIDTWTGDAMTPFGIAIDGALAAVCAVSDPLRPEAAPAIAALHAMGLRLAVYSGDHPAAVAAIGRRLGIDSAHGGLRPADKYAALQALQQAGQRIAFVGDGINDAPALAQANVGVAIGTGTDIAIEAADVVLMSSDLQRLAAAIRLSRATMRNIRQNLGWAFGYNLLLIPLAAGALVTCCNLHLSPQWAAAAMAASSLCVVGNALRLRSAA